MPDGGFRDEPPHASPSSPESGERGSLKPREMGRRKLIRALGATGIAVSQWSKPVVDSVIVPLYAQASPPPPPPPVSNPFSETQDTGEMCPAVTSLPVPDPAPFVFSWPGRTPTGDGTLTVTANGDLNGNEGPNLEAWAIEFNGNPVGSVGNTGGGTPATDTQVFMIPLADLQAAAGSASVTAANFGVVDCDAGVSPGTNIEVTLAFPATSP